MNTRSQTAEAAELREHVDRLIAVGGALGASRLLASLWARERGSAAALFVVSRYEALRDKLPLLPYRLAILRSFTVEPLIPLLRAAAFAIGVDLTLHVSDFNVYAQEILDQGSELYSFAPDAAILAVQTCDVAPELWQDCSDLTPERGGAITDRVVQSFRDWIAAFRKHSPAQLIVHTLEQPAMMSRGVLDIQSEPSQSETIQKINRGLHQEAAKYSGVYLLDYDALVARYGRDLWHDERKWQVVRLPIAAPHLIHLTQEWMRFLHPLTGKVAKALVVDLDNTLWGGVIGEDGMDGIQLGSEYPGSIYQALQRVMLDLHQRGVLLAICSKNNPEDAMEVLHHHPGMLLQPRHFAAMRINWNDKAQSLREIATELNIGLDALAFLDDNPIERQQVRSDLPEVTVIELSDDPVEYALALRECPVFERLTLSEEDQRRSSYYAAQRDRGKLEQNCVSREDFYRSLQQEAEIAPFTSSALSRITQLTNKTNQFNLTTRRYTEHQIIELANRTGWYCFSIRVRDRYGDNGLVGTAITHGVGERYEIDTFLLSCRVIGRTVETAFLSFLADHARALGATRLQGWFKPTRKNAPAKDFYPNHGFALIRKDDSGSLWELDLSGNAPKCPDWVRLILVDGAHG